MAGLLGYNGDPTGKDAAIWLARLPRGAKEWSYPEVLLGRLGTALVIEPPGNF